MTVRAKFRVVSVDATIGRVELEPVVGGSDENDRFFHYTPGGRIELQTINEDVIKQFPEGAEVYVDFTPAG